MIPKINARGSSFKGLAAYLLHDKDAQTSGRVAWVETINLATRNPETAWRVMAATAMSAADLKAKAGVKRSGRSSKDAVLHISLSWSPGQNPDHADMAAFARRALQALKAEDRQAMIIGHNDTDHSHLHLIVNRVSPMDGRMLSSSNEKLALSELALTYEREQGQIECPQRVINAERREKGEYVRGEKDMPRAEYETMREAQEEAEQSVAPVLFQQHPDLVAKLRKDFRQRWRGQLDKAKADLKAKWRKLYDANRRRTAELTDRQGVARQRVRIALGGIPGRPSVQLAREGLTAVAALKARTQQFFERERTALADESRRFKNDGGQALRAIYEAGLKQLALFRPFQVPRTTAGGVASIPQQNVESEGAQRYLSDLVQRFRQGGQGARPPARVNEKRPEPILEKEWEPEP